MFVLGTLSIFFDFFTPWLPGIAVFVYGYLLFYSAKSLLVSHSEMTNNSPYFLGFLLFLVSLFAAFRKLAFNPEDVQVHFVVRQLGSALLTTIVGLPFRQLLFAYAPAQHEQDVFFRTLEEELRRNAVEFKKSQTQLVQLLQEFIATREILFSEEEKAAKRYVASLTRASQIFDEAFSNYPRLISSALTKCSQGVAILKAKVEELAEATGSFSGADFSKAVKDLESLSSSTSEVVKELQDLRSSIRVVSKSAEELPDNVRKFLLATGARLEGAEAQLQERVNLIRRDLETVDAILDEFIDVSKQRIAGLR